VNIENVKQIIGIILGDQTGIKALMYDLDGIIKNTNNETEIKVAKCTYLGWKLVSKPGEYKQEARQINVGSHTLRYVGNVTLALWHKNLNSLTLLHIQIFM